MKHLALPQNWTVTAVGDTSALPANLKDQAIPAVVPGCVHTDLLAAELIPDPYLAENEKLVQWIGEVTWCYAGNFEVSASDLAASQVELACDGLDTVATVELNGHTIGHTQNMNMRHRFDAKPALRIGTNELKITFAPALAHAEAMRDRLGDLPTSGAGSNPQLPHHFIRKMACNMGWDWGPCLITAGIWRDIRLEAWDTARLGDVRPVTRSLGDDGSATLDVHIDLERAAAGDVIVQAALTGHGFSAQKPQTLTGDHFAEPITFDIPDAQLWWPVGHGEQPLYDLTVWLEDGRGETLEKRTHRVGLRTSEIATTPDDGPDNLPGHVDGTQAGAGMTLKINGKPVYCKGANWIPDDCFPSRLTHDRLRQRITQARDAHMNMLRVWGGGMYESYDFYNLCDELGILVWQDFLMACAAYAEEEPFLTLIEDEARDNVARLAAHPSLVMWCGNNENLWAYDCWNYEGKSWPENIGKRGWGPKYYFELLPPIVNELAPTTPYWPGSPYSSDSEPEANANHFGDKHIWDVWHGTGQYRNYLGHFPRFASEFGYHGPPSWPNIEASVPADQWSWNSGGMNHHNKNSSERPGQQQTHDRMGDDFFQPDAPGSAVGDTESLQSFHDWLYLAQVMQARALDMGVSWFRALHPYCSGALYWQLNDCWPVSSWSAIDSDGRLKPLWYASKRFFAPRLLTIKPRQVVDDVDHTGKLALYAHNDSDTAWQGVVRLQLMDAKGQSHAAQGVTIDIAPRDCQRFDVPDDWHDDADQRFIAAEFLGNAEETDESLVAAPAYWWFSPDKELDYAEADFDAALEHDAEAGTYFLTVQAHSVIRDLCIFADRLDSDAVVSDQCITLLPDQAFEFAIQSSVPLTLEALTAPPVLQAVNRFGRQATMM